MRDYLQPQSVNDVLRNAFGIYVRAFGPTLLTYLLPILPFQIWNNEATAAHHPRLALAGYLVGLVAGLFAFGAMTITVSDICLGNKPSVARSYKRLFGAIPGKLAVTNLLTASSWVVPAILLGVLSARLNEGNSNNVAKFAIIGGEILCVLAIIVAVARLMFAPVAVVLEGVWGFKALKRSNDLVRGLVWRNLGVLALIFVVVLGVIVIAATGLTVAHIKNTTLAARIFTVALSTLLVPPFFIAVVLLYYDTRARKEAYNSSALAEDLRR